MALKLKTFAMRKIYMTVDEGWQSRRRNPSITVQFLRVMTIFEIIFYVLRLKWITFKIYIA